ncbi:unnamed protein product [Cylindrotheca closterium]|uniref:DUF6824 domain-containing protein n=1 Tax=Cylindrotheca closterium TaxID=2856 RepID=A0AAD2PVL9_9STRA|nr:unnamed protein product [Cylindrotheca closterium]
MATKDNTANACANDATNTNHSPLHLLQSVIQSSHPAVGKEDANPLKSSSAKSSGMIQTRTLTLYSGTIKSSTATIPEATVESSHYDAAKPPPADASAEYDPEAGPPDTEGTAYSYISSSSSTSSSKNSVALPVKSNKKAYKTPVEDGTILKLVDVVLGRGGLANNHPGNKDLLGRIKDLQTIYKRYSDMNRQEKNDSTRLVFDWIKERGGRFLKMDPIKECWREVDQRQAYNKVMHMFRDDHSTEGRARKRKKYSKHKLPPSITSGTVAFSDATSISGSNQESVEDTEGQPLILDVFQATSSSFSDTRPTKPANLETASVVVTPTPAAAAAEDTGSSHISEKDVLFGRGGHANNNSGNQNLLEYIKSMQDEYKAFGNTETGKKEKKKLTLKVVEWVHNQGGRFLRRDKKDGPWEETTEKDARLKVSQLFRNDHTPAARLRKRKKYSGDMWSKKSPDDTTAINDSSSSNLAQDNDNESSSEVDPMEDQKPAAVDTPVALSKLPPNLTVSSPVASVSSNLAGLATLAANESEMGVNFSAEEQATDKMKEASSNAEVTSENEQNISAITLGEMTTAPPPNNPMEVANPITNVTLPEGALSQFHMPFQYLPFGMHSAPHPFDVMQSPSIQPYLSEPQAAMHFAAENPIVASVPSAPAGPNGTPKSNVVGTFSDKDVLLGRGGHANHHPGNKTLLDRVKMFQPTYKSFGSEEDGKKQKNNLTRELVEWVQAQGGRFLKRSGKDVPWREVSYNEARMKVSHLFRNDHTPEGRERKRKRYANANAKNASELSPNKETEKK